jgi:endoglucanase
MDPETNSNPSLPRIGPEQIQLLERLCTANAVSGDEREVRQIVLDELRQHAPDVQLKVDALGNVLASRPAGGGLRVMAAAHMDEVGFMITECESEAGILRFETVGGLDVRHLVGKPVLVGRARHPGVIGAKPIHLTTSEERQHAISLDTLRIDLGPAGEGKAQVGDRAVFATTFQRLGPSLRGRAMDDRLGVASLLELVKNPPPGIDLLAAFTVQEEVGLRGARVAAYAFDPQAAVVLDCTPANDLPAWDGAPNGRYNTRLDGGPALYIADSSTLSDPRLVRHFAETAEAGGIPFQFRQPGGGGTDAGAIHKQRAGVPSVSISVPGRYIHTPATIVRLSDWENTLALVYAGLARLTSELFAAPR